MDAGELSVAAPVSRPSRVWWIPLACTGLTLAVLVVGLAGSTLVASRFLVANVSQALAFPWVGAAMLHRHPGHVVGWLFCLIGVTHAVTVGAGQYAALGMAGDWPGSLAALWVESWIWFPGLSLLATSVLLRLPDGELPSQRWRSVELALAGVQVAAATVLMFQPEFLVGDRVVDNPVGAPAAEPVIGFLLAVLAVGAVVAAAGFVVRVRRSDTERRRQLAPLMVSALLIGLGLVLGAAIPRTEPVVQALVLPSLPLATAVSVFRYRLYDLEPVLRRSATYLVLVAGLALLYLAAVTVLGLMMRGGPDTLGSVVAAALVVAAVAPVHDALRRLVARWLFGERDDPGAVLTRLGHRLEGSATPGSVLGEVVGTIAEALRLPGVAIDIDGQTVAATGAFTGEPHRFPLAHGSVEVGELLVAGRSPGEDLSRSDRRALEDVARHAGAAAAAVQAAEAAHKSDQRLLTAHEDERRRVRRELHDGLGPTLAALAVQLDVLRAHLPSSDHDLLRRAIELRAITDQAIAELRRTVRGLRPLALDELGLVGALEEMSARLSDPDGLVVELSCTGRFDHLPPDSEVTALRIVQEAVTNVVRHSGARRCHVSLDAGDDLVVEVSDDGSGLDPDRVSGEGTVSMRERVQRLGGDLIVGSGRQGGVHLRAWLPVRRA